MRRTLLSALLMCLVAISAVGQEMDPGLVVYPEKLRQDVEITRRLIHEAHPDPYRYCTRAELDRLFNEVIDSIKVPISTNEFIDHLLPVFHRIGDSHLCPQLDAAAEELLHRRAPLLPLSVRIMDSALYVADELKGFRSLQPGSRLISIDRRPATEVLAALGQRIVTDGANATARWRGVEQHFPVLYQRVFGGGPVYSIEVEVLKGQRTTVVLHGMTLLEMEMMRRPALGKHPWHSEWVPESGTLWTTFSTLDEAELERSGQNASHFLDGMLKDLKQNGAKTLVLDLRGAGGRELGMAELVFAVIASDPFRVVEEMTVRCTAPLDEAPWATVPIEHLGSVRSNYMPAVGGGASLRPDDERLEYAPARPNAFKGTVYIVCDGATRDAAAVLVMLAKRHQRARIIGEEVGTNAYSFTGGRELLATLPNSRVRLSVPLVRYLPEGTPAGPMDHGELPHHAAQPQQWGVVSGRDTVRQSLLEMIKELQ